MASRESEFRALIDGAIEDALAVLPLALRGEWEQAMTRLHSQRKNANPAGSKN